MDRPVIAFLGIGLMGGPMAARLARAGHPVRAWNRTFAKAEALRAEGAEPHAKLPDAVAGARIVISMLEAGPIVREVMAAALPALAPGSLWIDMSSTRQDEALDFHAILAARGCRFLDAPVSGGVGGAQNGQLAIMAGGSQADFDEAAPLLRAMGTPRLVGPAGSGQVAKLCNQLIVGATLNVVAEALLLAQAAGADPVEVREAIRGGFAGSRILEVHGQRMLERNFVAGGQVKSQLKDLHNVLAAAGAAGLALPVTELVTRQYETIAGELPQADHAAALIALERMNPGQRLGDAPDRLS
ncbi:MULTISPECIES: NAD(P)-dependent oxidoreductase [unclassified Massilia]|uniref:NAD(P)-dependent oxidoreductase n=1 Tax=unclassified Massilia TaxID=2609279 RepID=UPI001B83F0E6|nr:MULTISPECIES: NAD(P)-dependent oxidoreductase [unclassified Massilia]MBQ5941729.1 NAD(P)-dependent oxidoreductase [Massilia sp. AB1]MBQ5961632.1 NAD(P)-dependent oxidoreductase [Massilia sp. ZL223]